MASNELVRGRCCCDMWLFNERMSTHFIKKEVRGKTNDALLVLHWGTGRDLLVGTGNVVSHRLLILVICGESPPVDTGNVVSHRLLIRVICGESPPVDRVICGVSPPVDTCNLW